MIIHCIDASGLTPNTREALESVWGPGTWSPATLRGLRGEVFQAEDGKNVFATTETVRELVAHAPLAILDEVTGDPVTWTRRQNIRVTVEDLVSDFLYYDREDDESLGRDAIPTAIAAGEVSVEDIAAWFHLRLKEGLSS